jgi:hypothetical protein
MKFLQLCLVVFFISCKDDIAPCVQEYNSKVAALLREMEDSMLERENVWNAGCRRRCANPNLVLEDECLSKCYWMFFEDDHYKSYRKYYEYLSFKEYIDCKYGQGAFEGWRRGHTHD